MSRRSARVSEAQWSILLEYLEHHPQLARARGYNNSARGRAEALKLWEEVTELLNAEGSGTTKTAKDWSIYVSNYKSKLKKTVADINADASGTGGGPPRSGLLSEQESRFLSIMGEGFGQTTPQVRVEPFHHESQPQLSTGPDIPPVPEDAEHLTIHTEEIENIEAILPNIGSINTEQAAAVTAESAEPSVSHSATDATAPNLPRRSRQLRYRSRPLAPLDEARRILSQVEMQRAASDAATARALDLIGQNLGRLADSFENFLRRTEPH